MSDVIAQVLNFSELLGKCSVILPRNFKRISDDVRLIAKLRKQQCIDEAVLAVGPSPDRF
jgi:hypothetical protein